MILPPNPTVHDFFSETFVKNVFTYLAGDSDIAEKDISGDPFNVLMDHYKKEFEDVPKVIEWIKLCGDFPEQTDSFVRECAQNNIDGLQQDVLTFPIEKLISLVNYMYRILCIIVLTSARGNAMAWAATNINYIPASDKHILERFTVIGDTYEPDEIVSVSHDISSNDATSLELKYSETILRNNRLNEELTECQCTIESLKEQLTLQKEENKKILNGVKKLQERLASQKKEMTGEELYKKGRFEVAILESVIKQLMIREKERNVFKSM